MFVSQALPLIVKANHQMLCAALCFLHAMAILFRGNFTPHKTIIALSINFPSSNHVHSVIVEIFSSVHTASVSLIANNARHTKLAKNGLQSKHCRPMRKIRFSGEKLQQFAK